MSSLVDFARSELKLAGLLDKGGDYNGMLGTAVLELMEKFSDQGHSGFSASMVTKLFERVSRFEPLSPLTGCDEEWMEVGEGVFQNKRCSHVFKGASRFNGKSYDIEARIFREPNGSCFTSRESAQPIDFPYTPAREYVDVPSDRPD